MNMNLKVLYLFSALAIGKIFCSALDTRRYDLYMKHYHNVRQEIESKPAFQSTKLKYTIYSSVLSSLTIIGFGVFAYTTVQQNHNGAPLFGLALATCSTALSDVLANRFFDREYQLIAYKLHTVKDNEFESKSQLARTMKYCYQPYRFFTLDLATGAWDSLVMVESLMTYTKSMTPYALLL